MPFHGNGAEGGFFDSAFEFLGTAVGGALFGAPGALAGGALGGAIIRGDSQATSTAPIAPFPAGPSVIPPAPTFGGFDIPAFSPAVREVTRVVGPPLVREIGRRFLERGPMPNGAGSLVTLPAPGGQVVCKPVSRRTIILIAAKAHSGPGATAKKIIRAAKECGIEIAAATFGLAILDVCFLIANPPRRRARGISARDMRTTNRVLRGIDRVRKNSKKALGGR